MEKATYYIGYILSALLLILPCYFLWKIKSKMILPYVISMLRMAIQLVLVGVYMKWIFLCNSVWIDLLWLVLMGLVVTVSVSKQANLRLRLMFLPIMTGLIITSIGIGLYVLFILFTPLSMFDTRYIVPIIGILLGCMHRVSDIALNEFYSSLRYEGQLYEYMLGNGATHLEAIIPFVRRAIEKALKPTLAHLSVAGILTIPGLFLGQLLGGISPMIAALNTVLVFAASVFASVISVVLTIFVADRYSFDCYGRLRRVWRKD